MLVSPQSSALYKGVTLADFHLLRSTADHSEEFINLHRDGAIIDAAILRILALILSTPVALYNVCVVGNHEGIVLGYCEYP